MTGAKKLLLLLPLLAAVALVAFSVSRVGGPSPRKAPPPPLAGEVDLDLSNMSATMVYSQVFGMMTEPASFLGKSVRVRGVYATALDEASGKRYHACFVSDAAACCRQGIEFSAVNATNFPADFPAEGADLLVQGVFDTYEEGGTKFPYLRDAEISFHRDAAPAAAAASAANRPPRIVATVFPIYDWTRAVLGTNAPDVTLTMLLDDGVDLHSFQPTADDLLAIGRCDLFLHVGGYSDEWVDTALASVPNPRRRVLNLVKTLGGAVKPEKIVEGMEHGEDHAVGHGHGIDEIDEHVWLSLRFAATLVDRIAEELAALDPARAEAYRANAAAYRKELAALDADYAAAVAAAPRKTLVVADRFPFRYLTDDYGLDYFAAFAGCSAETEASFQTVVFLAKKADELGARALVTIEGTQHRVADTVRAARKDAADTALVELDSIQSVTAADVAAGKTYLGVMRRNLEALRTALR